MYDYESNPLCLYGVNIEKYYERGAATSSYPYLEVWCVYDGCKVECPDVFGGISNPSITFADVDGDGVPDIIFGNEKNRVVVAFKPGSGLTFPRFIVIENNPDDVKNATAGFRSQSR